MTKYTYPFNDVEHNNAKNIQKGLITQIRTNLVKKRNKFVLKNQFSQKAKIGKKDLTDQEEPKRPKKDQNDPK